MYDSDGYILCDVGTGPQPGKKKTKKMIAEKPSWVKHDGLQIFSIDIQPGALRFATGGGDYKVLLFSFP